MPQAGAGQGEAEGALPLQARWPDTTLVIKASGAGSHGYESVPTNGCSQTATPQNSPQSMWVWPGLRLIGAGGKIPKGVFVAVAEVEPDGVRLDNGG